VTIGLRWGAVPLGLAVLGYLGCSKSQECVETAKRIDAQHQRLVDRFRECDEPVEDFAPACECTEGLEELAQ